MHLEGIQSAYDAPLRLNRWVLLVCYIAVSAVCSYTVGNPGLWRVILREHLQDRAALRLATLGFAATPFVSFATGPFVGSLSPIYTGSAATALFAVGVTLLLSAVGTAWKAVGMVLLASVFPLLLSAHSQISRLFSHSTNLVFDMLSASTSLSTAVPLLILCHRARPLVLAAWGIAVAHIALLPRKPFDQLVSPNYAHFLSTRPQRDKFFTALLSRTVAFRKIAQSFYSGPTSKHYKQSLQQDCKSPLFFLLCVRFVITLTLKFHFLVNHGGEESGRAVLLLAFSWIPTIYLSRLASEVSPIVLSWIISVSLSTSCATAGSITAIVFLPLWSDLPYSHLYMTLQTHLNPLNFPVLQAIALGSSAVVLSLYELYAPLLSWLPPLGLAGIVATVLVGFSIGETFLIRKERLISQCDTSSDDTRRFSLFSGASSDTKEHEDEELQYLHSDSLSDEEAANSFSEDVHEMARINKRCEEVKAAVAQMGMGAMSLSNADREGMVDVIATGTINTSEPPSKIELGRASAALRRASVATADPWPPADIISNASSVKPSNAVNSNSLKANAGSSGTYPHQRLSQLLPQNVNWRALIRSETQEERKKRNDRTPRQAPKPINHQLSNDSYFIHGLTDEHLKQVIKGRDSVWQRIADSCGGSSMSEKSADSSSDKQQS